MYAFNWQGEAFEYFFKTECINDEVCVVGLARYSIILYFNNVIIRMYHRADFFIGGKIYAWTGEPIDAPLWQLAGAICRKIELINVLCIRLELDSGDKIDLWTDEGQYESIMFEWRNRTADRTAQILDIF